MERCVSPTPTSEVRVESLWSMVFADDVEEQLETQRWELLDEVEEKNVYIERRPV